MDGNGSYMHEDIFALRITFALGVTFARRYFYTEGHFCTIDHFCMRVEKIKKIIRKNATTLIKKRNNKKEVTDRG